MKNKSLKNNIENSTREKVTRFSIRKVSFGAASVAVSALFMALGQGAASAAETNTATEANVTNAATHNNTTAQDNKKEEVAAPVATTTTPTTPTTAEKAADKINEKLATEANVAEKKEQTTSKAQETSNTTAETAKPAEVTAATTESNKSKSRKKRAAEPNSTTTDTTSDEAANQVYTAPQANAGLDELKEKLEQLPSAIQNNTKINNMDGVGATTGVEAGKVKEITEFGGWKAVNQADGSAGKFVVARATDKGVFPIETINTVGGSRTAWIGEQSVDRNSKYMLFLSEVRTQATRNKESYEGQPYQDSQKDSRGGVVAIGVKGYKGVEKTFKVYDTKTPGKVTVDFKTGFSGIAESGSDVTVANYKVEVFSVINGVETKVYTAEFDPKKASNPSDTEKTVVAAKTSTAAKQSINVAGTTEENKAAALETLSKDNYKPYATGGRFTSKEIELPEGTTEYKVRISAANDRYLGMDYHSRFAQYALPLTGVDFNISQNTNVIAKDLLTKIYAKLKETVVEDEKGMTTDSIAAYDAELAKVKTLVEAADLTTTDKYKELLGTTLQKRQELKTDKEALTNAANADATATKAKPAYYNAEEAKKAAYDKAVADAAPVLAKENATPAEVEAAKKVIDDAKAALNGQPTNKEALTNAANADATATKATPAYYNAEEAKKAAYDKAVADAAPVLAKENATQAEVDAAKKAVDDAKAVLNGQPTNKEAAKAAVEAALAEKAKAIEANDKLSDAEKQAAKDEAKKAADEAKKAIEAATDQAGVDAKATEGTKAVEAVNPVGKEKAKAAVDAALAEKEKAIEANNKLSDAEKQAAKDEAKKAADEAKKAIEAATDQTGVDAKAAEGKAAVEAVNPVGNDKAKEEVEGELAKKLAELENSTDLTDAEKATTKTRVLDEAKKAIEAIEKATTQEEVEQAIRNFVYHISAVVLEKEEYDLSKLFVNGTVIVKQGEVLTDKDILSKLNLPEGVEVVKVEKPETVVLGKGTAKVTLKLADGTQVTITVPVTVVEGTTAETSTNSSEEETTVNTSDVAKSDATEKSSNNVSKKQLPNTGTTETNTGLAGLGLAMLTGLFAVARRRKNDKN